MSTTVLTPLSFNTGSLYAPEVTERVSLQQRLMRLFAIATVAISCSGVLLVFAFYGFISWHIAHPPVAVLNTNPMAAKHLAYSDISFPSAGGGRMTDGWWIPAGKSERTVVLSHGFGANREEYWVPLYDIADMLHKLNYNVLMFDYGYADSKHRSAATGGILESRQLVGALEYAHNLGSRELIVWGFSMGAGTALQAGLETKLIDGMILDSTFVPNMATIAYNLKHYPFLPTHMSVKMISLFMPLWTGIRLDQIPSEQIQSTAYDFPLLLIHGTADDKAPYEISERIAKSQHNKESSLWIVQNTIHEMAFRTHKQEYTSRTSSFLRTIDISLSSSVTAQAADSAAAA